MELFVALVLVMEDARRVAYGWKWLSVERYLGRKTSAGWNAMAWLTFLQTRCSRFVIARLEKMGRRTSRRSFAWAYFKNTNDPVVTPGVR